MKKISFIGFGNMGRVLLTGLLQTKALKPDQVSVFNRTRSELEEIKKQYPQMTIVPDLSAAVNNCDIIFSCVATAYQKHVLQTINNTDVHVISISNGLEITTIEQVFRGKITRIMPTIISEIMEGYTLVCHNDHVADDDKHYVHTLLEHIGNVEIVTEGAMDILTEITSCGPGIYAALFNNLKKVMEKYTLIEPEKLFRMIIKSSLGTLTLLEKNSESFENLIDRVATKGGSTEVGVSILNQKLPAIFDQIIQDTASHNDKRKQRINTLFLDEQRED